MTSFDLVIRNGIVVTAADIMHQSVTITNAMLHHNVDYMPYEGMKITGYPETTISRGDIVWHRGEVLATAGRGEFLPCGFSSLARPKPALNPL